MPFSSIQFDSLTASLWTVLHILLSIKYQVYLRKIYRSRSKLFSTKLCYIIVASWHHMAWWRHQMETFSALLAICAGNSPVPGEFPAQRPVTRGFDVFFDLRLNKRLSKQSWGWWFETPSCSLWCQCNGNRFGLTLLQVVAKPLPKSLLSNH